jgi:hypothetical protein
VWSSVPVGVDAGFWIQSECVIASAHQGLGPMHSKRWRVVVRFAGSQCCTWPPSICAAPRRANWIIGCRHKWCDLRSLPWQHRPPRIGNDPSLIRGRPTVPPTCHWPSSKRLYNFCWSTAGLREISRQGSG